MAYEIGLEALCEEVAEYLDLDPRFWDQDSGSFPWNGMTVFFTREADSYTLEVDGETVTCGRH